MIFPDKLVVLPFCTEKKWAIQHIYDTLNLDLFTIVVHKFTYDIDLYPYLNDCLFWRAWERINHLFGTAIHNPQQKKDNTRAYFRRIKKSMRDQGETLESLARQQDEEEGEAAADLPPLVGEDEDQKPVQLRQAVGQYDDDGMLVKEEDSAAQGRKLVISSQSQKLRQLSDVASDWLFTQPIRSQRRNLNP